MSSRSKTFMELYVVKQSIKVRVKIKRTPKEMCKSILSRGFFI